MSAVLIVDDEGNIRRMLSGLLEAEGYEPREAADGEEALRSVEDFEPEAVLLDLAMPKLGGMDVLRTMRQRWPNIPVIMMSGRASLHDAVQATRLGALHFIEKPLTPEAVLLTLKGALELRRAQDLSRALEAELGAGTELVGTSPAMCEVREMIRRVAPTDARVLIQGESGTGKELAASALHGLSPRAGSAFVRVNSAALPRELIESELFGHERGAFTDAVQRRRGRFELADGGSLFLDEVADLGPEAQAKLLRALESGEIQRVGGQRPIKVDVRVIAATNRDLAAATAAGEFRADLFYRLNVLPVHMPPLRDRLDDVPELVEHLLGRLYGRHGLVPPVIAPGAMARLMSYPWPGNVRELANICERLAILYAGCEVGTGEIESLLPDEVGTGNHEPASLAERLDSYERGLISDAVEATAGNIAEAAKRLRTDRSNLYRRMKRLGIR